MRPKKTILMYCPNEVTRDVLTFQMQTWGLRVYCTDLDSMMVVLLERQIDLVLLVPGYARKDWRDFNRVAQRLEKWQTDRGSSIRIYDTMHVLRESVAPAVHRIPSSPDCAELLRETIKTVVARKRGPRTVFGRPLYGHGETAQKAMVA